MARFVTSCLIVVAILLAADVRAEDSSDTALAEALFRDARELMDQKKYAEACPKLEESYRLVEKLGTLLNLATCHERQGRTGSAWGEYTKAVTAAKQAGEEERVEYARTRLAELEGKLTNLVVEVPEPVPGIQVLIDDKPIGKAAWRTPIPLDPGEHELIARAPGHALWSKQLTLPRGPSTVSEKVPALKVVDASAVETAEEPSNAQWIAGWVVGAVGVVALGVGAYFGIDTILKQNESEDHCVDTLCDAEGVALREDGEVSANVANVTIAIGAAAVVTGIVLLVTADRGGQESGMWLGPVVGSSQWGLAGGARW